MTFQVIVMGALVLVVSVLAGWALPAWAASALLPALEGSGHLVTNYRGRRIPTGLGLVWVVWAVGALLVSSAAWFVFVLISQGTNGGSGSLGVDTLLLWWRAFTMIPAPLVFGAGLFGLVDDLFGDASAKGFRGHLSALFSGRLTTGGLKLLGIGVLALIYGLHIGQSGANLTPQGGWVPIALRVVQVVLATLVIALAANLVNLMDLRPGRALKAYSVLALIGIATIVGGLWVGMRGNDAVLFGGFTDGLGGLVLLKLMLVILALGPVLAVWNLDLGERAMLGDAGANAMGAFAGYLLAVSAPVWLLAVYAALLFALNLASEKYSFSRVIERVRFLRWIDGLGRLPVEPETSVAGDEKDRAGGPGSEGDDA